MGNSPENIEKLRAGSSIPFISANIIDEETGESYFQTSIKITAGKLTIGIAGITDRVIKRWTAKDGRTLVTADPVESVKPVIEKLREDCDLVVLLAHIPRWNVKEVAIALTDVDLILGADGISETRKPLKVGNTVISYAGRQGKLVGVIKLRRGENKRWSALEHELVVLKKDLPEDPEVKRAVERAKAEIAHLESDRAVLLERVNKNYTSYAACIQCHRETHDVWTATKHYTAYDSLSRGSRPADDTCLPCHTTGYGDGGFVDLSVTPRMTGVQCEACHGPGMQHSRDPETTRMPPAPDEDLCRRCHDRHNSPGFDYETYRATMRH